MQLCNRVIRSAAFEGMSPGGKPSDALVDYHRQVSAGGVGMTTVAYASVSRDGLTYPHQLCLQQPGAAGDLRRLTQAVHREGAAACIQLGHAGYFASRPLTGTRPLGASRVFNAYTLTYPRKMTENDIRELVEHFGRAVAASIEAGFDAVELQFGHGYLISQFLSPYTNRRRDRWGGSLDNRLRLAVEVLRKARQASRPGFPLLIKMNLSDGFPGGLQLDEAVEVARRLESEGADALILSGGFVSKTPMYIMRGEVPYKEFRRGQTSLVKKIGLLLIGRLMIKRFPFEEAYFLEDARKVRQAVKLPLVLVGGLRSLSGMEAVLKEGFDFLALARPLIIEPDLIRRMEKGETSESRCEPCNKCIAEMDKAAMRCVLLDEK